MRKLYRYLRSKGMEPWLDAENLLPGENWEVEIPNALYDSDVILACLSIRSRA
ncbi:MAG: toll/interleukin-1 receptor domain-containing protein [Anaerolineales bacterium]|nr:toll/interleukin-1 receptor domain-containing protein [Anaerolineales bacterium]